MKNETTGGSTGAVQKLSQLIKDIPVAMLTTLDPDGALRSRPMQTQKIEFDGQLWFFTSKRSGKAISINHDQHVNLSYASPDDNRFISVTGRAEIVEDKAKARELWSPVYRAWFPEGADDPDLALLKVNVESAEYWDSPSSALVHLAGFTKAVLTGERYQRNENERVDLKH